MSSTPHPDDLSPSTDPVAEDAPPEWDEELFRRTDAVLTAPPAAAPAGRPWFWLLLTVGLFAVSMLPVFGDLSTVGYLIAVLFVHEAGHFLGMRLFGYRDVRMFFVPFFGAAVSGRKHAAPAWQHAVVLMLGPLPGIAAAFAVAVGLRATTDGRLGDVALLSAVVNGLNLLPLVPLDGGRLLDLLLFARRPALAAAFRVLAAAGLGVMAFLSGWVGGCCVGVLALGTLLSAPFAYQKARVQRAFRDNPLRLPPLLEGLDESQRRELFGWAVLLHTVDRSPASLAAEMRQLHERMVSGRASLVTVALFLLLYTAGIVGAVVAVGALAVNTDRDRDRKSAEAAMLLVSEFRGRADIVSKYEEAAGMVAANGDRAGADALRADGEREWSALVGSWKSRPQAVRSRASSVLLSTDGTPDRPYFASLVRLQADLEGVPPQPSASRPASRRG